MCCRQARCPCAFPSEPTGIPKRANWRALTDCARHGRAHRRPDSIEPHPLRLSLSAPTLLRGAHRPQCARLRSAATRQPACAEAGLRLLCRARSRAGSIAGHPDHQHQRSLQLPLPAALRSRQRVAVPAAGLSSLRLPGRARRRAPQACPAGLRPGLADRSRRHSPRAITPATRAIVLVHPNNPTGHFTKPWEAAELARICREFDLSLIVDEVFLDYSFGAGSVHLRRGPRRRSGLRGQRPEQDRRAAADEGRLDCCNRPRAHRKLSTGLRLSPTLFSP